MDKIFYKNFIFFVVTLFATLSSNLFPGTQDNYTVTSPDGKLKAEVFLLNKGLPAFNIFYENNEVMTNNKLGLVLGDEDFSENLKFLDVTSVTNVEDTYSLISGKKVSCKYSGNKRVFQFTNSNKQKIEIVFQVSNDGVAFHYYIPGKSEEIKKITEECTYFNFNKNTSGWIQPLAAAKSGWCSVNPSYEEHYQNGINITELPTNDPGWTFPALFKSESYWICLTETAPDRNYCGCRLLHDSLSTGFKIGFPQQAEVIFNGSLKPESKLPWKTPWRIIAIGRNLKTLVESTIGTDLSKPNVIEDYSFVKAGRSSWSWVLLKDDSTIYPVQKKFIDYAADMGWEYCLIDADWDRRIGYEKIAELSSYAATKGVGLFLWYNSAGDWNTAPYTPRDKLLTHQQRCDEFKRLNSMGIKGVKIDFWGGDGQSVMCSYQDIIEDAAQYKLMVNCHGSTIPRGWQRTYPNLVTMESIRGFEFVTFEQINADKQPEHCTIIPFTRNLFDPMDFTPVCFSEVPGMIRKTSSCFELALSVLFTSGVQHFAEIPQGMNSTADYVKQMMREVPVAWDETVFIDGYPGEYVLIARKKDNRWFVAGINGTNTDRTLMLNLDFLNQFKNGLLITSGENNRSFELHKDTIDFTKQFKITLNPNDGFLLRVD